MSAKLPFPAFRPTLRLVTEQATDFLSIRGVRLPLDHLVDHSRFLPEAIAELRQRLLAAAPFQHLVLEGLFNP